MDMNKMRPISDVKSNTEVNSWKSKERRNIMVKKIGDFLMKRGNPFWTQNLSTLMKSIERFEKEVFDSANDEDEYNERIFTKMKATRTPFQSDESNLLPSNIFGSGEDKEANTGWQEHIYQKIQMIKNKNFSRLNILYNGIGKRLQQHDESVPEQPKMSSIVKCKQHKHALECIFSIFRVNKSKITPDFEQKLDKVEKYIYSIEQIKNVSLHSKVSRGEKTSTKKPTSQLMSQHSSHLTKPNFSQVEIQFSNSHPCENLDKQGYGNVAQQQTSGEMASPIINNCGILTSPLIESCNDQVKENSLDHIDDSSPEMQNLLKLLSSVSVEALVASCGDIKILVHLDDDMSTLEPLIGPPIGSIGSNLEGVFLTDSQARYLSHGKFVPRERKLNRFMNSMSTNDSSVHSTSTEKSSSSSNTSQENNVLSQEIKEINKRLIDTEVVVDKKKICIPVVEGDIEHDKEFIIKLCFNSVTVNPNLMSKYTSPYKKLIIEPLWLHIPTSYPHGSVVILDEMASDCSNDLDDLSVKAKLKLRLSLLRLSEPFSLKDIATLWDQCAREAICEHAQLLGGGTFTSKYGGWETCFDDAS